MTSQSPLRKHASALAALPGLIAMLGVAFAMATRSRAPQSATRPVPAQSAPVPTPSNDDLFDYADAALLGEANPELIRYGRQLVEATFRHIGPAAPDSTLRYAGNELTCKSCHLNAGTKKFAAPYVGVTRRYPNFRKRENRVGTIEQRVNGCMERSMNGRPLPEGGREMQAIVAYMQWLSHATDAKGDVAGKGLLETKLPDRAVDLARGKQVYSTRCVACHGPEGLGLKLPDGHGYQFPPLAGEDTYNTGAGMHRVLTAMAFIKGNMPLGTSADAPALSDDDAYDVAGYVNSLPRPTKRNTERDFPDRKLKPMSTPYPPYADDFPEEQHKYGPFPPIQRFYAEKYGLKQRI